MGYVLDLDGVLWLGTEAIPGAPEAVAVLRGAGEDIVFCTNNSSQTLATVEEKLDRLGISPDGGVITSAMAGATLIEPGERVLVVGGPGIVEAVEARDAEAVADGEADAVMVGFDLDFDYQRLSAAFLAIRGGARFIATNDDRTYPTPVGLIPGGGAMVAAIAYATGVEPVVAGKPNEPMATLIRARLGEEGTMVGDRPDTDGQFARTLGYRWALVLSGVTRAEDLPVEPEPDVIADDLATLVAAGR